PTLPLAASLHANTAALWLECASRRSAGLTGSGAESRDVAASDLRAAQASIAAALKRLEHDVVELRDAHRADAALTLEADVQGTAARVASAVENHDAAAAAAAHALRALAALAQMQPDADPEPLLVALRLWLHEVTVAADPAKQAQPVDETWLAAMQRAFARGTRAGTALQADPRFDVYRDRPVFDLVVGR